MRTLKLWAMNSGSLFPLNEIWLLLVFWLSLLLAVLAMPSFFGFFWTAGNWKLFFIHSVPYNLYITQRSVEFFFYLASICSLYLIHDFCAIILRITKYPQGTFVNAYVIRCQHKTWSMKEMFACDYNYFSGPLQSLQTQHAMDKGKKGMQCWQAHLWILRADDERWRAFWSAYSKSTATYFLNDHVRDEEI